MHIKVFYRFVTKRTCFFFNFFMHETCTKNYIQPFRRIFLSNSPQLIRTYLCKNLTVKHIPVFTETKARHSFSSSVHIVSVIKFEYSFLLKTKLQLFTKKSKSIFFFAVCNKVLLAKIL